MVMASSDGGSAAGQFDAFRDLIEELVVQQGLADKAIIAILNDQGFKTSARSLQRRLKA